MSDLSLVVLAARTFHVRVRGLTGTASIANDSNSFPGVIKGSCGIPIRRVREMALEIFQS